MAERILFVDTETIGLTGPIVIIQTGYPGQDPELHDVWDRPVRYSLSLIEDILTHHVNIYNMTFDSFHLHKWYNICRLIKDKDAPPDPVEVNRVEKICWQDSLALRPKGQTDSMIMTKLYGLPDFARFKKVVIRAVPLPAVGELHKILEEKAESLPDFLFKGYTGRRYNRWSIQPSRAKGCSDFVLAVNPSFRMKDVYNWVFNARQTDLKIPEYMTTKENSYDPHFTDWLPKFKYWRDFWYNVPANRNYAADDIYILDRLWNWLSPLIPETVTPGKGPGRTHDVDSALAWHIGAGHFRGFSVDTEALAALGNKALANDGVPTEPKKALAYLKEVCSPIECMALSGTSGKVLKALAKTKANLPLAERAEKVFAKRQLQTQLNLLGKLAAVGRFHPDFNICGAASNRMSGTGGINAQGIDKQPAVRSLFTFADEGLVLCGGDFDGQEVTILDAVCDDPLLRSQLGAGMSIHKIFGSKVFEKLYEEITDKEKDQAKVVTFGFIYGVNRDNLGGKIGASQERGHEIFDWILKTYPAVAARMRKIERDYCSMTQPGGLGTKVQWEDPKNSATSLFGYTRSFLYPNMLAKQLFDLSNGGLRKAKVGFANATVKVVRRVREQSVLGAVCSALYGAAFKIMTENLRVANNQEIQASGAFITKYLQYRLADLQPIGVHPFVSLTMNVHDEVLHLTDDPEKSKAVVKDAVEYLKQRVPLLSIGWKTDIDNWYAIKGK